MLELTPAELDFLGERVSAFITRYLGSLEAEPVLPAAMDPARLRHLFAEPLPLQPQGVEAALHDFTAKIAANSVRIGHPRFLGWTRPSPLGAAIFAEALAAALNQSVAVWDGAPAATEVELRVIAWLREMSGYAPQSGGLLTSGGSMANFIGLLAARSAADPLVRERGLAGAPPFTLYITAETHYSVLKAAEMLGLGRRYVRRVETDGSLHMDPTALAESIQTDLHAGLRPLAVVATLGTVNSGACDDLLALGRVCRSLGVWLHVDGAYGGLLALAPEKQHLAAGLAEADSLAFDPHKSLYMPFEAGCILVRNPQYLKAAFAVETDYLPNSTDEAEEFFDSESAFHFRDYGPQLSRSFRALKIYLALKIYGVAALAASMAQQFKLAASLANRILADPEFELLAPAPLGIVAFRYRPARMPAVANPAAWLDALNTQILAETQRRGQVFLSGTRLRGGKALRACFVSHRTTEADLDIIMDEVRAAGLAALGRL